MKLFNHVIDIQNKNKVYPNNPDMVVFFHTPSEYYIYAPYTKKDQTQLEIIQVDEKNYTSAKNRFNKDAIIEMYADSLEDIGDMIKFSQIKAVYDNMTLAETLAIQGQVR